MLTSWNKIFTPKFSPRPLQPVAQSGDRGAPRGGKREEAWSTGGKRDPGRAEAERPLGRDGRGRCVSLFSGKREGSAYTWEFGVGSVGAPLPFYDDVMAARTPVDSTQHDKPARHSWLAYIPAESAAAAVHAFAPPE